MLVYEKKIVRGEIVRKIAFVTGSRADYGIMRRYLALLNGDKDIDLKILVTGALLSDVYGHQVDLIYKDGFEVSAEIEVELDSSSNKTVLHTMAETMDKFGGYFDVNRFDLLRLLQCIEFLFYIFTVGKLHMVIMMNLFVMQLPK